MTRACNPPRPRTPRPPPPPSSTTTSSTCTTPKPRPQPHAPQAQLRLHPGPDRPAAGADLRGAPCARVALHRLGELAHRRAHAGRAVPPRAPAHAAAEPVVLGLWDERKSVTALQLIVCLSLALGVDENHIMVVPEGSFFYRVTITHEGAWVMEAINAEGSVFLDALNAQAARFGAQLVISHVAAVRRRAALLLPPPPPYTPAKRIGSSRGGTHPNFGTARQRSPRVTNRAIMVGQRAERRTESFGSNSCGRQRRSGGTPPGCTRRCAARRQPVAQTCEARTPRAGERRGRAPRRSSGRCLLHNPLKQLAAGTTRGREDDCAEGMLASVHAAGTPTRMSPWRTDLEAERERKARAEDGDAAKHTGAVSTRRRASSVAGSRAHEKVLPKRRGVLIKTSELDVSQP